MSPTFILDHAQDFTAIIIAISSAVFSQQKLTKAKQIEAAQSLKYEERWQISEENLRQERNRVELLEEKVKNLEDTIKDLIRRLKECERRNHSKKHTKHDQEITLLNAA
jgi:uncharacterized protein YlxW (UPF0749 family)